MIGIDAYCVSSRSSVLCVPRFRPSFDHAPPAQTDVGCRRGRSNEVSCRAHGRSPDQSVSRSACVSLSLCLAQSVARSVYVSLSPCLDQSVSRSVCVSLSLWCVWSVSRAVHVSIRLGLDRTVSRSVCVSNSPRLDWFMSRSVSVSSSHRFFNNCALILH